MTTNNYARLFTANEYQALTRDGMFQALRHASPTLAKGKSRATKEELIGLYADAANSDSIPVLEVTKDETGIHTTPVVAMPDPKEQPAAYSTLPQRIEEMREHGIKVPDFSDDAVAQQAHQDASMSTHVHGPDCEHDHSPALPKLAGVEYLERVNPDMPTLDIPDGALLQLPPEGDALFTFKGAPREVTEKEKYIIERLKKNYDAFAENPANTPAKKEALACIYTLKQTGIIANPKFAENIKNGRVELKDARRKMRAGVDISEIVQEAKKDEANKQLVADGRS